MSLNNKSEIKKIAQEFISILNDLSAELATKLEDWFKLYAEKNWWNNHVIEVLEDSQYNLEKNNIKEISDFDLYYLLKLLRKNFSYLYDNIKNDLKIKENEKIKNLKNLIYEAGEVRNKIVGHVPASGYTMEMLLRNLNKVLPFFELMNSDYYGECFALTLRVEKSYKIFSTSNEITIDNHRRKLDSLSEGITLNQFVGKDDLTKSQIEATANLYNFLATSLEHCFILKGHAGTGKTFLIEKLVKYLKYKKIRVVLIAPTGRAASIYKEKYNINATTIHKCIYILSDLKEYREMAENGDISYKFYFELKNNDFDHDTVFIVDEASMISDVNNEAEFLHFGSGRLLHDLLEYINFDNNDNCKKLIFVGDPLQLPPVGMPNSPALEKEYLKDFGRIESSDFEIQEVVRQRAESLIIENAMMIREAFISEKYGDFKFIFNEINFKKK